MAELTGVKQGSCSCDKRSGGDQVRNERQLHILH